MIFWEVNGHLPSPRRQRQYPRHCLPPIEQADDQYSRSLPSKTPTPTDHADEVSQKVYSAIDAGDLPRIARRLLLATFP
jgi:hypothetical protein